MFNLMKKSEKLKSEGNISLNQIAEGQLKELTKEEETRLKDPLIEEKLLADVRNDEDIPFITEKQMKDGREPLSSPSILEHKLNTSSSKLTKLRDDSVDYQPTMPIGILNQAQYAAMEEAYKKADKEQSDDYSRDEDELKFWDNYVNSDFLYPRDQTEMVNKMGPTQLPNNPSRFSDLTTNADEVSEKSKVDKIAQLKFEDAKLFAIYKEATGRELDDVEKNEIKRISEAKVNLLIDIQKQANTEFGEEVSSLMANEPEDAEQLHNFVSDVNTPHDEKWEAAMEKLHHMMG